jgi:flavorubredoxin
VRISGETMEKDAVRIAEGIYWVGYADKHRGLHCNPYLIVEGEEAVLIDGGNRDDFSTVMLKILRTGVEPAQITRLIYQHYDPDLCGSLPQFESIINTKELRIISHRENNVFIHYYSARTQKLDYRDLGGYYDFATGRRLEFYGIPYCHQPGSFVTYDTQTKTLFSSDLFGSFDSRWELMLELGDACKECLNPEECPGRLGTCPLKGIVEFHRTIMTSDRALTLALDTIETLDIERVAPQHGSVVTTKDDAAAIIRHLRAIEHVGIDSVLSGELQ